VFLIIKSGFLFMWSICTTINPDCGNHQYRWLFKDKSWGQRFAPTRDWTPASQSTVRCHNYKAMATLGLVSKVWKNCLLHCPIQLLLLNNFKNVSICSGRSVPKGQGCRIRLQMLLKKLSWIRVWWAWKFKRDWSSSVDMFWDLRNSVRLIFK